MSASTTLYKISVEDIKLITVLINKLHSPKYSVNLENNGFCICDGTCAGDCDGGCIARMDD